MKNFILFFLLLMLILFSSKSTRAAPVGNQIIFNGGYIQAQTTQLVSPQSISFEVFIKPKYISGIRQILTVGSSQDGRVNYQIGINGGSLSLRYLFNGSSLRVITSGNLEANIWQHIGISISPSSTKLFINGTPVKTSDGATGLPPVGNDIYAGSNISPNIFSKDFYLGEMDQLRISTGEINIGANWQNGLYNSNLPVNQSTQLMWNFDQPRGEISAIDSSGKNITGILTGNDAKIHYYGTIPTPTKYILPTLPPIERITFPTLPVFNTGQTTVNPGQIMPVPAQEWFDRFNVSGYHRPQFP